MERNEHVKVSNNPEPLRSPEQAWTVASAHGYRGLYFELQGYRPVLKNTQTSMIVDDYETRGEKVSEKPINTSRPVLRNTQTI